MLVIVIPTTCSSRSGCTIKFKYTGATISKIEASDYFKNQSQKSAGVSVGLQHAKNQRSKKVRRHLK